MNEYVKQAKEFLKVTNSEIKMQQIKPGVAQRPSWATDKKIQHGFEYRVALIRNNQNGHFEKDYRFSFWDSIANAQANKRPTEYDILACLSGSIYCPETFDDFIAEYGYEIASHDDYKRARATYKGVKAESEALHNLYTEKELQILGEIQ